MRSYLLIADPHAFRHTQPQILQKRIGALHPHVYLAAESDLGAVVSHVDTLGPGLLIVDSVQTITAPEVDCAPGGVSQVREVAGALIRLAKERVEASRGQYQAAVGAIFPVINPAIAYQHFGGTNQNANGTLVDTNFNNVLPSATLQWIVNPGRVFYDIVAARRRIEASEQFEYAAELERRFDDGWNHALSIAATPEQLRPPAGLFVVATLHGSTVGRGMNSGWYRSILNEIGRPLTRAMLTSFQSSSLVFSTTAHPCRNAFLPSSSTR